jgi:hypothetical protein
VNNQLDTETENNLGAAVRAAIQNGRTFYVDSQVELDNVFRLAGEASQSLHGEQSVIDCEYRKFPDSDSGTGDTDGILIWGGSPGCDWSFSAVIRPESFDGEDA